MHVWKICPLRALGIAACDEARARMIGKHVLDLIEARAPNHDDPFVQSIASCLTDLQAFVAGQSMSQQLEAIVAPARFHNVNESSLEGLHASTNRSLNSARNYGPVHMALAHHLASIRRCLGSVDVSGSLSETTKAFQTLAHCCRQVDRADKCLTMLDIDKHPVIAAMKGSKDIQVVSRARMRPSTIKVIYHCDSASLHCDTSAFPSPAVKAAIPVESQARHCIAPHEPVWHEAMVEHIMTQIQSDDVFLLVPIRRLGALGSSLLQLFETAVGSETAVGGEEFEFSSAPVPLTTTVKGSIEDQHAWIALSCVHFNASKLKRSKYQVGRLSVDHVVVAVHAARHCPNSSCKWKVALDPMDSEHRVMVLSALSCEALSSLWIATRKPSLQVMLAAKHLPSLTVEDRERVDGTITLLCSSGAGPGQQRYVIKGEEAGNAESWRLVALEALGLATRQVATGTGRMTSKRTPDSTYWQLTRRGVSACVQCHPLVEPTQAIAPRADVGLIRNMDTLELLVRLEKHEFSMKISSGQRTVPPYDPTDPNSLKVFYIKKVNVD